MRRIIEWLMGFLNCSPRFHAWTIDAKALLSERPEHAFLRSLFPGGSGLQLTDPTPRQHQPFQHRKPRQRAQFRYRRLPNYRALSRALETALRDALVPRVAGITGSDLPRSGIGWNMRRVTGTGALLSGTSAVQAEAEAYALSLYGDA